MQTRTLGPSPIVRTAAWFYVAKRVVVVMLLLAAVALAGAMVFAALARDWLLRWGA